MALPVAGYDSLIEDILRRTEEQRKVADARGMGEAQRRGLVNPTGTSDIEMSLRRAQTEPVVQGGQSELAKILSNIAEQQEARKYQTSERLGSQEYGTSERLGSQGWQSGENLANRNWQTGERVGTQGWQSGENLANRNWQTGERQGSELNANIGAGYIDPDTGNWNREINTGLTGERMRSHEDAVWGRENAPKQKKSNSGLNALTNMGGQALGTYAGVAAGNRWY